MTGRWLVCVTVALALLAVGVLTGVVQNALLLDQTGIVWVVVTIGIVGSISARWKPSLNDWFCEHGMPLMFGLLGTVVGFMAAITGVIADDQLAKMAGVDTALSTTAVGLVTHICLLTMQRMMRE